MKNCICLNGVKIELTPEQVAAIGEACDTTPEEKTSGAELATLPVGATFTHCGHEFIVLEHKEDGITVVCFKGFVKESVEFGDNNCYEGSNVDEICCELAKKITDTVEFELDLTSDDGLDDYGTVSRAVALMTVDMYRKYVRILDKHKISKWWWLATPWSTRTHNNTDFVKCVSPSGYLGCNGCSIINGGVRPFCILKSNIFVS